ncbi:MAG: diaminopimelate epimerase [Puniceicoccales bacterium]|nr:diaminopimelate epimerase [Puniceicoccales bacterium]
MSLNSPNIFLRTYDAGGNRFFVAPPGVLFLPDEVAFLCRRWGCDGLLMGFADRFGEISLRIANGDGTAAEMSGNGVRIYFKYLLDSELVTGKTCAIRAAGGTIRCELCGDGSIGALLGPCRIAPSPVSLFPPLGHISGRIVSVGNPHFVVAVERFPKNWQRLGSAICANKIFADAGTNVEFSKVTGCDSVELRVWERGVGRTKSCGSGAACAAALLAKSFSSPRAIAVSMEGGTLEAIPVGDCVRIVGKIFSGAAIETELGRWLNGQP